MSGIRWACVALGILIFGVACGSKINPRDAAFRFESQDYIIAESQYAQLLEANPDNLDYQYRLAVCQFMNRRYRNSAENVALILEQDPKDLKALALLAEIFVKMRQARLARATLLKAIEYYPSDMKSYIRVSRLDLAEGKVDEAEKILRQAIPLRQDDPSIFLELSNLYFRVREDERQAFCFLKRYSDEAKGRGGDSNIQEKIYQTEIEKPEYIMFCDDQAHLLEAQQAIDSKNYSLAGTHLDKVVEQNWLWKRLKGQILLETGDHVSAMRILQEAVSQNDADPECHYQLGWAYHWNGEIENAHRQWKRVLDLEPGHAKAQAALRLSQ
ncbi:MAG: tetratricopeptide repeat protein [Deltaproteobacteria bacterium]|nr:tetratricopeptide repeat protein [Deltaproteobacteria bacterium]